MASVSLLQVWPALWPVGFGLDALITAATAWLLVCRSGHARHEVLEAGLAWLWMTVALVAGSGLLLGITGGFTAVGQGICHVACFVLTLFWARGHLRRDRRDFADQWKRFRRLFYVGDLTGGLVIGLTALLTGLSVITWRAEPAVMDALNYHLPRLAHWLQEGHIGMIGASDERLDYITSLPEVVMAWMLGPVATGFRGLVLLQAVGGIMTVGATIGLARCSGLSRNAALGAGGLLLGMGNVVVQFTAAQTDLFTTGLFATAFYLWLVAMRRGTASVTGALGAGLALAAKGTLFYLAPAAILWLAILAWRHRLERRQWIRALYAGIAGIVIFAGPGFARNWLAYGDVRGPERWITAFHPPAASVAARVEKLRLNLLSGLIQNLEPQSQPYGLQAGSLAVADRLLTLLPETDPYTFLGQNRRASLNRVLQRHTPDADMTAFGTLTLVLFAGASLLALIRIRQASAVLVLGWSLGVGAFLITFNVLHQWHPFAFRYWVLIAPWVAIVIAWGLAQFSENLRHALWALVGLTTLAVGGQITFRTHQAGWATIVHPERTLGVYVADGWRRWSQELDQPAGGFTLSLPDDRPLAAFYRQSPRRTVRYRGTAATDNGTAQDFVRGHEGWTIVPAARYLGREGNVAVRTWLFDGEESNPYSLAAYRPLAAGETSPACFYRERWDTAEGKQRLHLLVKPNSSGTARLELGNPVAVVCRYTWTTPAARGQGEVPAQGQTIVSLSLPPDAVGEVWFVFDLPNQPVPVRPTVRLVD